MNMIHDSKIRIGFVFIDEFGFLYGRQAIRKGFLIRHGCGTY